MFILALILALLVACAAGAAFGYWLRGLGQRLTLQDLKQMEDRMAIKVSEIKTAVALIQKNNKEALIEIGNKIADLNQQIKDLVDGVGDPNVTDETFEADLRTAAADSQALADVVTGSPTHPE